MSEDAPQASSSSGTNDAESSANNATNGLTSSPSGAAASAATGGGGDDNNNGGGDVVSPPAMLLRSGRKKRRPRSIERKSRGTGTKRKRQRASLSSAAVADSTDDEQTYMTDNGDDNDDDDMSQSSSVVDGEGKEGRRGGGRKRVKITKTGGTVAVAAAAVVNKTMEEIPEEVDTSTVKKNGDETIQNDDDDDAEMKDAPASAMKPVESTTITTPPPGEANYTTTTEAPAAPAAVIPNANLNLRLPSEQTPAKTSFAPTTTTTDPVTASNTNTTSTTTTLDGGEGASFRNWARLRDFTTPVRPSTAGKSSQQPPPPKSLFASSPLADTVHDKNGNHTKPTIEEEDVAHEDDDDNDGTTNGRDEGRKDGLVHYFKRQASSFAEQIHFTNMVQRVKNGTILHPQPTRPQGTNEEDEDATSIPLVSSPWHKTHTWIVVLIGISTFLSICGLNTIISSSDKSLWTEIQERAAEKHLLYILDDNVDGIISNASAALDKDEAKMDNNDDADVTYPIPTTIIEYKEVEVTKYVDNDTLFKRELELRRQRLQIDAYLKEKNEIQNIVDDFENQMKEANIMDVAKTLTEKMDEMTSTSNDRLEEQKEKLKEWGEAVDEASDVMYDMEWAETDEEFDEFVNDAREVLGFLGEKSLLSLESVDLDLLSPSDLDNVVQASFDKIAQTAMLMTSDNGASTKKYVPRKKKSTLKIPPSISKSDLMETKGAILSAAAQAVADLKDDQSEVASSNKAWMKETVTSVKEESFPFQAPDVSEYKIEDEEEMESDLESSSATSSNNNELSADEIQAIIDNLLEIEGADMTNKKDYASIRSGSKVIHTGPRQTSLSISENMPLINLAMAKAGLRFYGNGANTALNPTFPKAALGDCWSFEKEGKRKKIWFETEQSREEAIAMENDAYRGDYATLSVRLSNPTQVKSVVIEHPPEEVSPSRGTAIRDFRVIGFTDKQARGRPWVLGSYSYDVDSDKPNQEFRVVTYDENGKPLPKMSSIVLAIDGNWGAEYSCLYRFRVHG